MIRVREDIHALAQQIAAEHGTSMQDVLRNALENYRRELLFARADQAYAALRSDPAAWQQELNERAEWEATLMDGIEENVPHNPSLFASR